MNYVRPVCFKLSNTATPAMRKAAHREKMDEKRRCNRNRVRNV